MLETRTTNLAQAVRDALATVDIDVPENRVVIGERTVTARIAAALRPELTTALYDLWHAGVAPGPAGRGPGPQRDFVFEAKLVAPVPHGTSLTEVTIRSKPVAHPTGDHVVVEIGRVQVRLPAAILTGSDTEIGAQVRVPLAAVRPCLSPGFLLVSGSLGGPADTGPLLRLYVHILDASFAPEVWAAILRVLEDRGATYRAKVLSKPSSFPRRDAVVVYLPTQAQQYLPAIVSELAGAPGLGDSTSLLAHRLAPGLAAAWEPRDKRQGWDGMSFGQHRAAAIADGMVRHMSRGVPLDEAVAQALRDAAVDPADPARNTDSPGFSDIVDGLTTNGARVP
jgi:hypothetical protein